MRIANVDSLLENVESDSAKLIVLYLSNVLISTTEEISERLGWTAEKTRSVCERLRENGVVTKIDSGQKYALSRAVMR